jgi:hypothetical protein
MVFEAFETAHSPFGVQPVWTSELQLGHVAVSICPTMNENWHSGHSSLGDGASGGGGGGGA